MDKCTEWWCRMCKSGTRRRRRRMQPRQEWTIIWSTKIHCLSNFYSQKCVRNTILMAWTNCGQISDTCPTYVQPLLNPIVGLRPRPTAQPRPISCVCPLLHIMDSVWYSTAPNLAPFLLLNHVVENEKLVLTDNGGHDIVQTLSRALSIDSNIGQGMGHGWAVGRGPWAKAHL